MTITALVANIDFDPCETPRNAFSDMTQERWPAPLDGIAAEDPDAGLQPVADADGPRRDQQGREG